MKKLIKLIVPVDAKNFYIHFIDIESQNYKYSGYGFGKLMMEAMFHTFEYFADRGLTDNDKLTFLYLKGALGVGANYTPEKAIHLYRSFDNFYLNNYIIQVQNEFLNVNDKEVYFKMCKRAV